MFDFAATLDITFSCYIILVNALALDTFRKNSGNEQ